MDYELKPINFIRNGFDDSSDPRKVQKVPAKYVNEQLICYDNFTKFLKFAFNSQH